MVILMRLTKKRQLIRIARFEWQLAPDMGLQDTIVLYRAIVSYLCRYAGIPPHLFKYRHEDKYEHSNEKKMHALRPDPPSL